MFRVLTFAVMTSGLLTGCGGGAHAPVSGVVTVDGQPYPNAVVTLQPLATGGNNNPGIGSSGITDAQGRFTLMTIDGKPGAVVGKHRLRIQTQREGSTVFVDPNVGSADSDPNAGKKKAPKGPVDPIPTEWYSDAGKKEFDVPAGGTDKANFDIVSKNPVKK